jgi:hypothetical protein
MQHTTTTVGCFVGDHRSGAHCHVHVCGDALVVCLGSVVHNSLHHFHFATHATLYLQVLTLPHLTVQPLQELRLVWPVCSACFHPSHSYHVVKHVKQGSYCHISRSTVHGHELSCAVQQYSADAADWCAILANRRELCLLDVRTLPAFDCINASLIDGPPHCPRQTIFLCKLDRHAPHCSPQANLVAMTCAALPASADSPTVQRILSDVVVPVLRSPHVSASLHADAANVLATCQAASRLLWQSTEDTVWLVLECVYQDIYTAGKIQVLLTFQHPAVICAMLGVGIIFHVSLHNHSASCFSVAICGTSHSTSFSTLHKLQPVQFTM